MNEEAAPQEEVSEKVEEKETLGLNDCLGKVVALVHPQRIFFGTLQENGPNYDLITPQGVVGFDPGLIKEIVKVEASEKVNMARAAIHLNA